MNCKHCKQPIGMNNYLGVSYWVHRDSGEPQCEGRDTWAEPEAEEAEAGTEAAA